MRGKTPRQMRTLALIFFFSCFLKGQAQCPSERTAMAENSIRDIVLLKKIKTVSYFQTGPGCRPGNDEGPYTPYNRLLFAKVYYNRPGYADSSWVRNAHDHNAITKTAFEYMFDERSGNLTKLTRRFLRSDAQGNHPGADTIRYGYNPQGKRILSVYGDTAAEGSCFVYKINGNDKTVSYRLFSFRKNIKTLYCEIADAERWENSLSGNTLYDIPYLYKPGRSVSEDLFPSGLAAFNEQELLTEQSYPYKKCIDRYCYEYY